MIITSHPLPTNGHTAWGVDRISFSFPVDASQCDLSSSLWSSSSTQIQSGADDENASLTGAISFGDATARIRLFLRTNWCSIEFNPSRVLSPKGTQLLPPEFLSRVVSDALDEVRSAAWPVFDYVSPEGEIIRDSDWTSQVPVKRLDLARNFRISAPESVKAALESKDPRYLKSKHRYTTGDGSWGIENRTKSSGKDLFYDKTAELGTTDIDPDFDARVVTSGGVLRFEAQMRRPRLQSLGLNRLDLITPSSCWEALCRRWDATGRGSAITTGGDLYRLVEVLPYAKRARLVGYLMLKAHGADGGISPGQERGMRKLASEMGLVPGLPLEAQGEPDCYLNLTTGELEACSEQDELSPESDGIFMGLLASS
jgi:hypothetical protein